MNKIRISGIVKESIVDGPGIRFVIFSQGCKHNCPGCHNPQTHSLNGGYELSIDDILKMINVTPIMSGVTFSGGEPFLQANSFYILAKEIHKMGLNIITYTGYTFENLLQISKNNLDFKNLISESDVIIDGPFIKEKRSLNLKFRGSTNQRIILVKESLNSNKIIQKF